MEFVLFEKQCELEIARVFRWGACGQMWTAARTDLASDKQVSMSDVSASKWHHINEKQGEKALSICPQNQPK